MTIQKNTSCPFCFSDLLFMGHIFNYLKEKCSARNSILIIKSFIWENVTLQKAALPCSYQRCLVVKVGGEMRRITKLGTRQNLHSAIPTNVFWILIVSVLQGTKSHSQRQNLMRKSCQEWCRNRSQVSHRQGSPLCTVIVEWKFPWSQEHGIFVQQLFLGSFWLQTNASMSAMSPEQCTKCWEDIVTPHTPVS